MKRVYIAGPYTSNPCANTHRVIKVADQLLEKGFIPFVPHLNLFWDCISPKPEKVWLEYDWKWLEVCDCVLRLDGKSPGADNEIKIADRLNIPVYYKIEDL